MNKDDIIKILIQKTADILNVSTDEIDKDDNFLELGISSQNSMQLYSYFKTEYSISLNPAVLFDYPSIAKFAEYIYREKRKFDRKNENRI